jgi:serine/threonine-protein kinase
MVEKTLVEGHAPTILASSESHPRHVDPNADAFTASGARYADRRVLGAGGMGEVRLCGDQWIGRDVAMKVVRTGTGSASETRGRFLREARVQGQLEHPNIVPVYDLGRLASGEAYFTMKRIGGHTLERVILGLRENDPEITTTYSRRKLLSAMSQVCLTVAYAHSRGVVHRDLKPANVMLGDFGEVYILDWGVAKIAGAADVAINTDLISGPEKELQTHQGALVGTPGFMSPEQARGDVEHMGPASDIYALGAMLFELLVLEPLHHGTTLVELVASSQRAVAPPSSRKPSANVPPELDAICVRATALEPADRFPSARSMHEAIERYLDGERDAERRKELARDHVQRALELLAAARAGGADAERLRSDGVRALGRAVALDPTDEGALRTISDIISAPPEELPPEGLQELKQVELVDRAKAAGRSAYMYLTWLLLLPVALIMGVKSWPAFFTLIGLSIVAASYSAWMSRSPERAVPRFTRPFIILNFVLVGAAATLFSPFIVVPGLAATSASSLVISIRANLRTRRFIFFAAGASIFVPAVLSLVGLLPHTILFQNGEIHVLPMMTMYRPVLAPAMLWIVTLLQILVPAILISRAADSLIGAELKNFSQAWRLRQLLPNMTR